MNKRQPLPIAILGGASSGELLVGAYEFGLAASYGSSLGYALKGVDGPGTSVAASQCCRATARLTGEPAGGRKPQRAQLVDLSMED